MFFFNDYFLQVPCSLVRRDLANISSIVEFGHGIFGNRGIATDKWLQRSSNTQGWIVWSSDWRGLSTVDVLSMWRLVTHDIEEFQNIESAVVQTFATKIALRLFLPRLMQQESCTLKLCNIEKGNAMGGTKTTRKSSTSANTDFTDSGSHLAALNVDHIETAFIGHSMGAIIGVSWSILAQYARSAHIAGGSPFTFVMGRSAAFSLIARAIDLQFYTRYNSYIPYSNIMLIYFYQCGYSDCDICMAMWT